MNDARSADSWISGLWFKVIFGRLGVGVLGLFFCSVSILWPPVGITQVVSIREPPAKALAQRSTSKGHAASERRADGLAVQAPDLIITTIEGKQYRLKELCRQNQVVVINFCAAWCPPCIEEMPCLERIHLAYRDRGVALLGIAVTETASRMKTLIKQQKITYEIAVDDENKIVRAFGNITAIPTTLFLDTKGNIVKTQRGCIPEKELEEDLKKLVR